MQVLKENVLNLKGVESINAYLLVKDIVLDEVHNPQAVQKSIKLCLDIDLGIVKQKVVCDVPKDLKDLLLQYYVYLGGQ